ncbi:MAG: hypothetical protein I3273_00725 [Candidatus Moeniiplasma glomeromycotorum]|nr:hypothetical protein [Candidatus Moeniiplasma glomeromycotorum]MCE8167353.1 hypothetical protein [Candidatus Moeniiplasma glomeromycotorum]MCE8168634.1 hypothetical protein [Candidatus Moeniiplasma glomeromycotorum]
MVITFVFGANDGGRPRGINDKGEQGIYIVVSPPFNYRGHKIHGLELYTNDIGNYNQTLRDRKIFLLQTEEASISYDESIGGDDILVINNSPRLRGFAADNFTFELDDTRIRENAPHNYLELEIKPRKLDPAAEGPQLTSVRFEGAFGRGDYNARRTTIKRELEAKIWSGSRKFTVQGFDRFNEVEIGGLFGVKETITFTIRGSEQIVAQTPQEEPNRDEIPLPNNDNPPPPPTITLDKEFTLQLVQNHGTWTSIQLANPEVLTEADGANYQFITLNNKTHQDKLKAGNTIRIKGIQVAPDKAQIKIGLRGSTFDILSHYQDIELVREGPTNNPPPPLSPKTPFEIIFEAIYSDSQLQAILTTARISGDDFCETYILGKETSLVNSDQTLNYAKIKQLLKIDNPSPDAPPNPNGPADTSPPLSDTPTQENNQKSEENIKEINRTASLEEAQKKAKQEINNLFDRYGVEAKQISATLWENEANWENYLTSKCSTVNRVSQFLKQMKMTIIQQSKQNQQTNQQLTVPRLRAEIKRKIKELLKKYPSIKIESIPALQNWEADLERKKSHAELSAFERQLREVIVSTSHQTSPASNPKSTWPRNLLIGGGFLFGAAALGCLAVIIRNKRVRRLLRSKKS